MWFSIGVASVAGVGFMPFAPGTWGSAAAVLLALPLLALDNGLLFLLGGTIIAYGIGLYASAQWVREDESDDPAAIVIDELVGQWLTVLIISAFMPIGYLELLIAFILFRAFDIIKPFPIDWVERNMRGAQAIMVDDIVAAIMAGLTYALIYAVIYAVMTISGIL